LRGQPQLLERHDDPDGNHEHGAWQRCARQGRRSTEARSHKIPAYPDSTEIPVDVLGAKYRWARSAGLL
jgi:CoA ligase-like protein